MSVFQTELLLVYPSLSSDYQRLKTVERTLARRPSLGMQYLMGVLRRAGVGYVFHDQVLDDISLPQLIEQVRRQAIPTVGLHVNYMTTDKVCGYIAALKNDTAAKVIVGGPGTLEAERFVAAGADAVVIGEAETRLPKVLAALREDCGLADIPGLCLPGGDGPHRTPAAGRIEDLESLPFPYRPPELIGRYGHDANPAEHRPNISLMASRGCPYRCSFCNTPQLWSNRVVFRSPAHTFAEIDEIFAQWPNAYLTFIDDVFGQNAAWIEEFCQRAMSRDKPFKWMCILNPLSLGKNASRLLPLMAEAGCNCISWGGQSADPDVLTGVNRSRREPEKLAEMVKLCKQNNILSVVTYIFGLPGDTLQTIEKSVAWTLKHRPDFADYHPLLVLPKSDLARDYDSLPLTELNSDDIEHAMANAYRRFYLHPKVIAQFIRLVLRHNPRFFLRLPRLLLRLLNLALFQGEADEPEPELNVKRVPQPLPR